MNMPRPERADHMLIATCALVFIASAWVTIVWCDRACVMHGTWKPMPGQGALAHFGSFFGMWVVMMVAMMIPVFAPVLVRFRAAAGREVSAWRPVAQVSAGYFGVWSALGLLIYPLGVMTTLAIETVVPLASMTTHLTGLVLILAGAFQFSRRKAWQLSCCRAALMGRSGEALPLGIRAGLQCIRCCAGLTVALLLLGVMDLTVMALVTLATAAERLSPPSWRLAWWVGIGLILVGLETILTA